MRESLSCSHHRHSSACFVVVLRPVPECHLHSSASAQFTQELRIKIHNHFRWLALAAEKRRLSCPERQRAAALQLIAPQVIACAPNEPASGLTFGQCDTCCTGWRAQRESQAQSAITSLISGASSGPKTNSEDTRLADHRFARRFGRAGRVRKLVAEFGALPSGHCGAQSERRGDKHATVMQVDSSFSARTRSRLRSRQIHTRRDNNNARDRFRSSHSRRLMGQFEFNAHPHQQLSLLAT